MSGLKPHFLITNTVHNVFNFFIFNLLVGSNITNTSGDLDSKVKPDESVTFIEKKNVEIELEDNINKALEKENLGISLKEERKNNNLLSSESDINYKDKNINNIISEHESIKEKKRESREVNL